MKILYIHENPSKNALAELFFSEMGQECKSATSLKEALAWKSLDAEIILLDIPLPFLSSKKELKRIRALAGSNAKIVCLYETTNREEFERLSSAGVQHYFPNTNHFEKLLRDLCALTSKN